MKPKPIKPRPKFLSRPGYVRLPGQCRNQAKSAVRAFEILEEFAIARTPLRAFEIGQALALAPSSVDQLLKTLVDHGYILFDERRKLYSPSPRFALIAAWLGEGPMSRLPALLRNIRSEFDQLATLSFRQGCEMQVALAEGRVGCPEKVTPGLRYPLFDSAVGLAALSTYQDNEIVAIIDRAHLSTRDSGLCERDTLLLISRIRAEGYSASTPSALGRKVLAIPFAGRGIPRGAAIAVSGLECQILHSASMIATRLRGLVDAWIGQDMTFCPETMVGNQGFGPAAF